MSIERLEFEVSEYGKQILEHGKQIKELYDKFTVLASLPDKIELQTKILRNIAKDLSILPEHKMQLAVIYEIIGDYKEHKKGCIAKEIIPKQVQEDHDKLTEISTKQIKEDHDKVTKMSTEWNMVKYMGPVVAALAGGLLGKIIDKLWP